MQGFGETQLKCSRNGVRASFEKCSRNLWRMFGRFGVLEGMDYGMSLSARREITKKEAREYSRASKKTKGEILDRLVERSDGPAQMPAVSSARRSGGVGPSVL